MIRHELIGLVVEVAESSNETQRRIKGMVVDETKNTLTIETNKGFKKIQKNGSVFIFEIPDGKRIKVDGKKIVARPEERIKLKVKRW